VAAALNRQWIGHRDANSRPCEQERLIRREDLPDGPDAAAVSPSGYGRRGL